MTFPIANATKNEINADLKEWLQCKDFALAMSGIGLGNLPVVTTSLRDYDESINLIFDHVFEYNPKINAELKKIAKPWHEASDHAHYMVLEVEKQINGDLVQLKQTPLSDKREVLRHMRIVPTPIAAAYLGVTEDDLNALKKREKNVFGENFLGGYCYSSEELKLMARNMFWFFERAGMEADERHEINDSEGNALDHFVMVDDVTARAFTNMTDKELIDVVPHTTLVRRRYRLADLEKVRIAKLSAAT